MRSCALIGGTIASVNDGGHGGSHELDGKAYERNFVPLDDVDWRVVAAIILRDSRCNGSLVGGHRS